VDRRGAVDGTAGGVGFLVGVDGKPGGVGVRGGGIPCDVDFRERGGSSGGRSSGGRGDFAISQ
jgi:hypothetical protein